MFCFHFFTKEGTDIRENELRFFIRLLLKITRHRIETFRIVSINVVILFQILDNCNLSP
jgi:hypothetical protein